MLILKALKDLHRLAHKPKFQSGTPQYKNWKCDYGMNVHLKPPLQTGRLTGMWNSCKMVWAGKRKGCPSHLTMNYSCMFLCNICWWGIETLKIELLHRTEPHRGAEVRSLGIKSIGHSTFSGAKRVKLHLCSLVGMNLAYSVKKRNAFRINFQEVYIFKWYFWGDTLVQEKIQGFLDDWEAYRQASRYQVPFPSFPPNNSCLKKKKNNTHKNLAFYINKYYIFFQYSINTIFSTKISDIVI